MDTQIMLDKTLETTNNGNPMYKLQLLDYQTGNVIGDVDVITSAECITYKNTNPIIRDILGFEQGDMVDIKLSKLVDNILYPYCLPEVVSIGDIGLDHPVTSDIKFLLQKGTVVDKFPFSVKIMAGSEVVRKCALVRYQNDRRTVIETKSLDIRPGQTEVVEFMVPRFTSDITYTFEISDGKNIVHSPKLNYVFALPRFMGNISHTDLVVTAHIEEYFNSLIKTEDYTLIDKKLIEANIEQKAYLYGSNDNKEIHPFILVPLRWNSLYKVTDANGLDITNSYLRLNIKLDINGRTEGYALYITKNPIGINSETKYIKEITYKFTHDVNFNESSHAESDILTGFNLMTPGPIDSRFVKDTYDELLYMANPYEGLVVYIKDIKTYYKYTTNGNWEVTNNKTHLYAGKPSESMGGKLDISIDIKTGDIWQKGNSNKWELKGNIRTGEV